jgi:hypothetical protein
MGRAEASGRAATVAGRGTGEGRAEVAVERVAAALGARRAGAAVVMVGLAAVVERVEGPVRAGAAGVERDEGPAGTASVRDDVLGASVSGFGASVDGLRVSVGALGASVDVDGLGASVAVRRMGTAGTLEVAVADRVRVIGLRAPTTALATGGGVGGGVRNESGGTAPVVSHKPPHTEWRTYGLQGTAARAGRTRRGRRARTLGRSRSSAARARPPAEACMRSS